MSQTEMVVGGYVIVAIPRQHGGRVSRSRVYVSGGVAQERDRRLRDLQDEEKALPKGKRFSKRGEDPEVDALYDRLNRRIAYVERVVAVEATRKLTGDDTVTGKFSRWAGCSCGCSPGVVLDQHVYLDGKQVDVWVRTQEEDRKRRDQHAVPTQAEAPAAESATK